MVSVRANLPEGMLFLSNSTNTFKSSLFTVPLFITTTFAAASFSSYQKLLTGVHAKQAAQKAAAEEFEPAEDDDDTSKGVSSNLQQIAFAAQSYFVDKPGAAEVTYEQLLEAELLFRLEPIAGESYKGLKLQKSGGTLTLKLPGGGTVSRKYGPVAD